MERRRLQLYSKNIRLRDLKRKIDALEFVLGPLYGEVERLEAEALARIIAKDNARLKPSRTVSRSRRKAKVTR